MTAAERFAEVAAYQTHRWQENVKSVRARCAAWEAAWEEDWLAQQEPGEFTAEDARAARLAHNCEYAREYHRTMVAPNGSSRGPAATARWAAAAAAEQAAQAAELARCDLVLGC